MAGFLSASVTKPRPRNPIMTIIGDAGLGKTTLAASFPRPLFIRAEDGMNSLLGLPQVPDALPVLKHGDEIWEQLRAVLKEEHDYQTLVLDSVSALDRIFTEDMIAEDLADRRRGSPNAAPTPFAQLYGGYGAAYKTLASKHERVRRAAEAINEKRGMTILFLSHADTEMVDLPDQPPYTRFSLRMTKKSIPPYVDGADLVGMLRLLSFVSSDPKAGKVVKAGKANSRGVRQLVCHATASAVTKNRYGLDAPIDVEFGINPLANLIMEVKGQAPAE